jgi:hypothetical protein
LGFFIFYFNFFICLYVLNVVVEFRGAEGGPLLLLLGFLINDNLHTERERERERVQFACARAHVYTRLGPYMCQALCFLWIWNGHNGVKGECIISFKSNTIDSYQIMLFSILLYYCYKIKIS